MRTDRPFVTRLWCLQARGFFRFFLPFRGAHLARSRVEDNDENKTQKPVVIGAISASILLDS